MKNDLCLPEVQFLWMNYLKSAITSFTFIYRNFHTKDVTYYKNIEALHF